MSTTRIKIYGIYERIWHWLQAALIFLLLITGLEIRFPGQIPLLGFAKAITAHSLLGFVLLGNAFLGLFYYLASGEIRQYLPEPRDFVTLSIRQAHYYVRGMFKGDPHPFERGPLQRLNVLQKTTYLLILNVMLPAQVLTGLLIWSTRYWPYIVDRFGSLGLLANIHSLCAWLFAAFVVMHVYLTTTGPTPLAHLRSMITGYDIHSENSHANEQHAAAR